MAKSVLVDNISLLFSSHQNSTLDTADMLDDKSIGK